MPSVEGNGSKKIFLTVRKSVDSKFVSNSKGSIYYLSSGWVVGYTANRYSLTVKPQVNSKSSY
jgi:hypothetical protein